MTTTRRSSREVSADVGDRRAAYLDTLQRHLWPGSPVALDRSGGPARVEYAVVPDRRHARLLVPLAAPRAAATAAMRSGEANSLARKVARRGAAAVLAVGAGPLLARDRIRVLADEEHLPTIESHLAEALAHLPELADGLQLAVQIGPARANRKPVLLVLSGRGALVGVAKLGLNDLTDRLVAREGEVLDQLAAQRLATVVPRRLHSGTWNDHRVLVQSALPVDAARVQAPDRVRGAQLEVATAAGTHTARLAASAYLRDLRHRVAALDAGVRGPLERALDHLGQMEGDHPLLFGAWHGDWTPWNMANTARGVLVWDWERYAVGVPVGFDALHFRLQRDVVAGGTPPEVAVRRLLEGAAETLAGFPVAPEAAPAVAIAYLVDIAARYAGDKQAEAGAALGLLGRWLLPAITDFVTHRAGERP